MTIDQIIRDIHRLNGTAVIAVGYLPECAGYECRLFSDRKNASVWSANMQQISVKRAPSQPEPPALGIGSGADFGFDARAKHLVGRYVKISGVVTDRCRDAQGQPGCTDRSTDIEPSSITYWHD